jgi:hypothetical protein
MPEKRRDFSWLTYLSFEQTEMAMKATWINGWLDEGVTVLGKVNGFDGAPPEYLPIQEALTPRTDTIECQLADGSIRPIYGYKKAAG